jgi:hypothetical protein
LPRLALGIGRIKIREEVSIVAIPEPAGIVGHVIAVACQVLKALDVAGAALMESGMSQ